MRTGILSSSEKTNHIISKVIPDAHFYSDFNLLFQDTDFDFILISDEVLRISNEDILLNLKSHSPNAIIGFLSTKNDINYLEYIENLGYHFYLLNDNDLSYRLNKKLIFYFNNNVSSNINFGDAIKGHSKGILKVFSLMKKASKSPININITGETGTGKELIAKSIHEHSNRKEHKLIAVNIASIPMDLIESELFGYEEGAFTGATKKRIGKFEEAKSGTLFLDEIGELPIDIQAKLLRVLQEGELTRLGGNEVIKTDFRLITATHRDLYQEVSNNNFREDLYYRILGLPIHIPPLRERKDDIEELANNFVQQACIENHITPIKKLTKEAVNKLINYSFPGNIRQLKAIIELSTVLSENNNIKASDLHIEKEKNSLDILKKERTLEEYNIEIIEHFLKKYQGKVNFVADKLSMSKSKIYKWISEGKLTKT